MKKKTVHTPSSPNANPLCDGFVIRLERAGKTGLAKAEKIAEEILGSGWQVEAMGEKSRDFDISRESGRPTPVHLCWERAENLKKHPDVVSAEPSLVIPSIDPAPSQVFPKSKAKAKSGGKVKHKPCSGGSDWSLGMVNARTAWTITPPSGGKAFGEGVLVGHPDTGYTKHPEVKSRFLPKLGFDFEDNDSDPIDPLKGNSTGHGGATASVIASPRGSQLGGGALPVVGTAPAAKIVPLRVSTGVIHLSFKKVAKAIRHAADKDCHVISMSLGGPFNPGYLERAIDYAIGKGVIILAAAGNKWPFVVYPARYSQVIGVAACNCEKKLWSGSATGKKVDVSAPGESVWRARSTAGPQYANARSSGTSYAVTTTAGVCALWLAFHGRARLLKKYGKAKLASVFQDLLKTEGVQTPPGWNTKKAGTGIVDAEKLLKATLPAAAPPVSKAKAVGGIRELAAYFPDSDAKLLRAALEGTFGVSGKQLSAISREIAFHLVTNPNLRNSIARAASKTAAKSKAMAPSLKTVKSRNPRLAGNASPTLKAAMGLK